MNDKRYCIDGRFLARRQGGQERFAKELLIELDKLCHSKSVQLIIPNYVQEFPQLENIEIIKYGSLKGFWWEQVNYLFYLYKNHGIGLYFLNTWPFLRPDYPAIHDMSVFLIPQLYKSIYAKLSIKYHQLLYKMAAKKGKKIITISISSKKDIIERLSIEPERIIVLPAGWQHLNRIRDDESVFDDLEYVKKGEYYFSLSSITPQKNFKWIIRVAKYNKDSVFVIAGAKIGLTNRNKEVIPPNVHFIGYQSDERIKPLMKYSKAFIHPAIFEGFGIPPLEAMSLGTKVIVSIVSCLPEIYGNAVYYIDPYDYRVDLDKLISESISEINRIDCLKKYSWEKAARLYFDKILDEK